MTNQEAIDLLDNLIGMIEDNHGSDYDSAIRMAINALKNQPEIIRCKDCKWCSEHYDTDGNVPYWDCINWDGGTDADGFCHEAELRGDKK